MDIENTPAANVAFTGVVADELSRLYREIKNLNNRVEEAVSQVEYVSTVNGKLLNENQRLRAEREGLALQNAELMRKVFLAENELSVIKRKREKK